MCWCTVPWGMLPWFTDCLCCVCLTDRPGGSRTDLLYHERRVVTTQDTGWSWRSHCWGRGLQPGRDGHVRLMWHSSWIVQRLDGLDTGYTGLYSRVGAEWSGEGRGNLTMTKNSVNTENNKSLILTFLPTKKLRNTRKDRGATRQRLFCCLMCVCLCSWTSGRSEASRWTASSTDFSGQAQASLHRSPSLPVMARWLCHRVAWRWGRASTRR